MKQQGVGRIINCSSILGFAGVPYRGAYNATKFAMEGLTDTLRIEHAGSPIHFSLIEPGPIATNIRQNSVPHFERWINWQKSAQRQRYESLLMPRLYNTQQGRKDRFELAPSAVTEKLIHALESASPKPRYYVTKPTHIAGFMKRLLTTRAFDRLLQKA
jgi:NAD(P)-dependent dehydrogenase (short-subunit alcohol dehydrogenase family)